MSSDTHEQMIQMVGLARGLEMGGFYNAAKLLWAATYALELRESGQRGIPTSAGDLSRELEQAIAALRGAGMSDDLLDALERGRRAVAANTVIPASDIPEVHVCRTCGEIVLGESPEACPACGAWELTFRTFPAVYYLEPLPPDQALSALTSAPGLAESMIKGLSDAQLERQPKAGEWSIREVLSHLLVAQELLAGRVTLMLRENDPELKASSAWEMSQVEALAPATLLAKFKDSREATVKKLKAAAPNGWWRAGLHEEFGRVTVLQQASYFAKHDHNHLTQIRQVKKALGI